MKEILNEQKIIKRFLLGDLEEEKRAALEDRFLSDSLYFEQIEDAENDLVDDYIAGRLDARDRKLFENYYLVQPENRVKLETGRILQRDRSERTAETVAAININSQKSFWHSIQDFFASWQLAPIAVTALVLLFVIGGFWFAFRPNNNADVAYAPTPEPTVQILQPAPNIAPEINSNISESTNRVAPHQSPKVQPNTAVTPKATPLPVEPKTQPTPQTVQSQQTVTLALVAGLVRGGGEANKLILPKNTAQVRFTFELQTKNYSDVEARIETVSGERVWSGKIKPGSGRVTLNLPSKLFSSEDYLLIVSGIGISKERSDFTQFYFNSEKK